MGLLLRVVQGQVHLVRLMEGGWGGVNKGLVVVVVFVDFVVVVVVVVVVILRKRVWDGAEGGMLRRSITSLNCAWLYHATGPTWPQARRQALPTPSIIPPTQTPRQALPPYHVFHIIYPLVRPQTRHRGLKKDRQASMISYVPTWPPRGCLEERVRSL